MKTTYNRGFRCNLPKFSSSHSLGAELHQTHEENDRSEFVYVERAITGSSALEQPEYQITKDNLDEHAFTREEDGTLETMDSPGLTGSECLALQI
ncbi:hypothetical protein Tco_0259683 [Tanacetum coccineum]